MKINEIWPDIYIKEYTPQFQSGVTHQIWKQQQSTQFKDMRLWNSF